MAEIHVPALGKSVTEATIGKWLKKAGDAVAVDEPLVELETDKVNVEVPSPAAGVLGDIDVKDGETVAVGTVLGSIKEGAGAPAKPLPQRPHPPPRRSRSREARSGTPRRAAEGRRRRRAARALRAQDGGRNRHRPRDVAGSGKGGQVTKGDMIAALERAAAQPTPVAAARRRRAGARALARRRRRARRAREDDAPAQDHRASA